jgi:hypothetical protein
MFTTTRQLSWLYATWAALNGAALWGLKPSRSWHRAPDRHIRLSARDEAFQPFEYG